MGELQESGHRLVKYLATRLVYHEMKHELFERLYFAPASMASPLTTSVGCLTLEAILARRQDGLLSLVEQTPSPLLVAFVVELGSQLTSAWSYVVLDYLGRQKMDQITMYLEEDIEALKNLLDAMMTRARHSVGTDARN